jgi:VWFA-related protein
MNRAVCLLLFLGAGGSLLRARAADGEVVFRSDVSLVRVDTQVVDRENRAITGLRVSDFVLKEEGRSQPIRNFASEDMPVDVVLLLDVSASMRPHVQRIASAAHEAFRVLRDADRVAIMVFDRSTRLRMPFRGNRLDAEREFESLLDQETFRGGTDITRGLLDAAAYVRSEGRREARRAIVILTDDQTERNRDVEGVSHALAGADAVVSLLLAPDAMQYRRPGMGGRRPGGGWPGGGWPGGPMGGPRGGVILGRRGPYGSRGPGGGMGGPHTQSAGTAEIARRSGGDTVPVDDAYALENTLARLRQRYALHFYLPQGVKPGEQRSIEVELADAARRRYPDAELRYRREYMAPAGPGAPGPAVITQAPVVTRANGEASAPSSGPAAASPPALKRRPAVNPVPDGSREGPLVVDPAPPVRAPEHKTSEPPA